MNERWSFIEQMQMRFDNVIPLSMKSAFSRITEMNYTRECMSDSMSQFLQNRQTMWTRANIKINEAMFHFHPLSR